MNKCKCGEDYLDLYPGDVGALMKREGLCFGCAYSLMRLNSEMLPTLYEDKHYLKSPYNHTFESGSYWGAVADIHYINGRIETANVGWPHKIPAHFLASDTVEKLVFHMEPITEAEIVHELERDKSGDDDLPLPYNRSPYRVIRYVGGKAITRSHLDQSRTSSSINWKRNPIDVRGWKGLIRLACGVAGCNAEASHEGRATKTPVCDDCAKLHHHSRLSAIVL